MYIYIYVVYIYIYTYMAQYLFREPWNHKSQVRVSCRFHAPSKPLVSCPVTYPVSCLVWSLWFHACLHIRFHTPGIYGLIRCFIPVVSCRFHTPDHTRFYTCGFIPYLWFHTIPVVSYPGPYPVSCRFHAPDHTRLDARTKLRFQASFKAYQKQLRFQNIVFLRHICTTIYICIYRYIYIYIYINIQ